MPLVAGQGGRAGSSAIPDLRMSGKASPGAERREAGVLSVKFPPCSLAVSGPAGSEFAAARGQADFAEKGGLAAAPLEVDFVAVAGDALPGAGTRIQRKPQWPPSCTGTGLAVDRQHRFALIRLAAPAQLQGIARLRRHVEGQSQDPVAPSQ